MRFKSNHVHTKLIEIAVILLLLIELAEIITAKLISFLRGLGLLESIH
jgi:hypothetical protein